MSKVVRAITNWSNSNPILSHAIPGFVLGFLGAWATDWWGMAWPVLVGTAQEGTDERANKALRTGWNGWDWRDWLGWVIGGALGTLARMVWP